VKKVITLYLESGRTIECTVDHRILTVHGFAEAGDLREGEMLAGQNLHYKPPKPSEREVREDIDDLYEDLPLFTKKSMCIDRVEYIRSHPNEVPVYCLYVPRWHCFQLFGGVVVSNCDALSYLVEYLYPVKRSGGAVSSMRLSGL
jgi:intein/homing endonuclease